MRPTGNLALSTAVLVSFGYVAQVGEFGDLAKLGVSDSNKVVRGAIQDAAPVAVTDEATVADQPKKDAMPSGRGIGDADV